MRHPLPPATGRASAIVAPRLLGQVAGVYYLLILIVAPSGVATATPLRMLLTMACDTAVALIFYSLFKPVSRNLSLAALIFRLIFVAMMTLGSLDYFGALDLPYSAHSAHVFNTVYAFALVPFGAHCLLIGYLICRSKFLARFLGVAMMFAGLAYVTFLSPWWVHQAHPYILIPGALGEGLLTLWLLIGGVDGEGWIREAGGPAAEAGAQSER